VTATPLDWIELVTSYRCNCACVVCPSAQVPRAESLSATEMRDALRLGRERGATGVWFGGGEPTLHPELLPTVSRARRLGYSRIRIQTNGLRLAYSDYCRELVRAGTTEVAVSVMGANAATHNAVARHERAFDLLVTAARNVREVGIRLEADVLVTTRSASGLTAIVERFSELGVKTFSFWWVSLHGLDSESLRDWLPRFTDAVPELERALSRARALDIQATTFHTPPCVLSPTHRHRYRHSKSWRLLVFVPGQAPFLAEDSPMEGGAYVAACARCAARANCLGPRSDYVAEHGSDEFAALRD
jgi:MoaA/NifB/PqqE/SkfB family radical SAM enzyme